MIEHAVLRRTRHREVLAVEVAGRRAVLKRQTRAERRDRWYRRLRGQSVDPVLAEARACRELRSSGFPVPRVLGCGEHSWLLLEWIEHEQHLGHALESAPPPARRVLLAELAHLVARFHAAGWYHRDLYVSHVLVDARDGSLALIDLGRARRERRPRQRWRVKDLGALHGSAPSCVSALERLRFLDRWLAAVGPAAGGYAAGANARHRRQWRRTWIGRIAPRASALFAHRPKDAGTDRAGWPAGALLAEST